MFQLSLRGLGVLNYENAYLVGECYWLNNYLRGKTNPIVVDVGSNIGKYSMEVMKANPTCHIYAFEPHPKTYEKLVENMTHPNFYPYNMAVGDQFGKMNLYDYESNDGSSHASLYREVISDLHKSKTISHEVDVIVLKDFFVEHNIDKIDLLKIDVEGNELSVLKGVKKYIENGQIEAIHFEFNEMNIISKTSFKDFWDILSNYDLYRILPGGHLLHIREYWPSFCEVYAFQNIIAILKNKK